MMKVHVAVVANLKHSVELPLGAPLDALADYDADVTVLAIQDALRAGGHEVFYLEGNETFLDTVRETRPDICFNLAEGVRGDARESHVPAILEMLGIPYTGSKVLTHAVSLDKGVTKKIWRDCGLPTAPFQVFHHWEMPLDSQLTYPLFVKPVHEGSGMGINGHSVVHSESALREQVQWVIETYCQNALAELYLPGREFTVGLVGNSYHNGQCQRSDFYNDEGFHVLPILEIDTGRGAVQGIYNAEAKSYNLDDALAPGYLCPADISQSLEARLKSLAVAAFQAIDCLDIGRVDFRLGFDGEPYLVEINTLPGLNPELSDLVISARAEPVAYEVLINEILNLACERYGLFQLYRV